LGRLRRRHIWTRRPRVDGLEDFATDRVKGGGPPSLVRTTFCSTLCPRSVTFYKRSSWRLLLVFRRLWAPFVRTPAFSLPRRAYYRTVIDVPGRYVFATIFRRWAYPYCTVAGHCTECLGNNTSFLTVAVKRKLVEN